MKPIKQKFTIWYNWKNQKWESSLKASWFMAGLAACCKSFPDSSDWPSAYLHHAVRAESESSIKESLELMDHKFAPGVFGGQKKFFVLIDAITEYYPDFKPLVK